MRNVRSIGVAVVATLLFGSPASAQPSGGGSLTIGPSAVLEDASTGLLHQVQIFAQESPNPGVGSVGVSVGGGGLSLCTIRGGGPLVFGQPVPTSICSNAGAQRVKIDNCKATIEAHASTHADSPHTPYLGDVTIDVAFTRTNAPGSDGNLTITIHAPKRQIQLSGKVTGTVTMPSCPF